MYGQRVGAAPFSDKFRLNCDGALPVLCRSLVPDNVYSDV